MGVQFFLILFPIAVAVVLLLSQSDKARDAIVKISAAVIAVGAVVLAFKYLSGDGIYFAVDGELIGYLMMIIEVMLAVLIFVLGVKHKKYLACILAAVQTPLMIWFEVNVGHHIPVQANMYVDKLNILMALIVGIIGSAITVYALGYMKDFHHHNKEMKDKRPFFFFIMFIFLAAMFGLVFSNNLIWMYFFWEVTSLSSFFMIGYTGTEEAVNNSFRALIMNLLGGLAFALAIVYIGIVSNTVELNLFIQSGLNAAGGAIVVIPAALLAFAGFTKSAQMPFTSWLTGAMVAPTPTSALLHSSTMVKAGVFLIIKLSPVLGVNLAGLMTMGVGAVTFLFAAFAAISQSNAKKVLAYSTVSNLGLIVICAGIGTYEATWVSIMLIIFHAVAKSLMFLCVGTAEHNIGSRDIESFDGLFTRMPQLAVCMSIGICGMFLAPFGMLVSKWVAMKAFVDAGHPILTLMLVFGSSATFFFWAKWLGKITAIVANRKNIEHNVHKEEWFVIKGLAGLTVAACLLFPTISSYLVVPYLKLQFIGSATEVISKGNMYIMVFMVFLIIMLPLLAFGKSDKKQVHVYMAGENVGDDLSFYGSMGKPVQVSLRNWYMEDYFGEKKMLFVGSLFNTVVFVFVFAVLIGGVL